MNDISKNIETEENLRSFEENIDIPSIDKNVQSNVSGNLVIKLKAEIEENGYRNFEAFTSQG